MSTNLCIHSNTHRPTKSRALAALISVYAAGEEFRDGVPYEQGLLSRIELVAGQLARALGKLEEKPSRNLGELADSATVA